MFSLVIQGMYSIPVCTKLSTFFAIFETINQNTIASDKADIRDRTARLDRYFHHNIYLRTNNRIIICGVDCTELNMMKIGPCLLHGNFSEIVEVTVTLKLKNKKVIFYRFLKQELIGTIISMTGSSLNNIDSRFSTIFDKKDIRNQLKTYTAAQKFPFKTAKQACNMNPDIISKSCT